MNYHIRVCVRGLIVHDNCIVLNEFNGGEYYNLPGGGAEPGESMKDTTTILPPTIPDVDPVNPNIICNGAKWIPIGELERVHYVPYISIDN